MVSKEIVTKILSTLPHQPPFRFIDDITYIDDSCIEGNYFLENDSWFYKGHFPGFPITPGVILTEIMAQIGMVAFGIYLMIEEGKNDFTNKMTLLTETNIQFRKQVLPGTNVFVRSEKILFRHGRLRCNVFLKNKDGELLCEGNMAGMLFTRS